LAATAFRPEPCSDAALVADYDERIPDFDRQSLGYSGDDGGRMTF
jgi:hypothetical protein